MVSQAHTVGARLQPACSEAGLSLHTFQRWQAGEGEIRADGRPQAKRPVPANKLSTEEQQAILQARHEPRFADRPLTRIVPIPADEQIYLGSESTFCRLLLVHDAQHHRGRQRQRRCRPAPVHVARSPNEVWCWDIPRFKAAMQRELLAGI